MAPCCCLYRHLYPSAAHPARTHVTPSSRGACQPWKPRKRSGGAPGTGCQVSGCFQVEKRSSSYRVSRGVGGRHPPCPLLHVVAGAPPICWRCYLDQRVALLAYDTPNPSNPPEHHRAIQLGPVKHPKKWGHTTGQGTPSHSPNPHHPTNSTTPDTPGPRSGLKDPALRPHSLGVTDNAACCPTHAVPGLALPPRGAGGWERGSLQLVPCESESYSSWEGGESVPCRAAPSLRLGRSPAFVLTGGCRLGRHSRSRLRV